MRRLIFDAADEACWAHEEAFPQAKKENSL